MESNTMMVKLDLTVTTSAPSAGVLSGLPVGSHVIYVALENFNYASDTELGGLITSGSAQNISVGSTVDNVTFNRITVTPNKLNI